MTCTDSPAASLLMPVVPSLQVGALATAVLAKVEQTPAQAQEGVRTLRWSNAGHPPPLLRRADGTVQVLARPADLLLGLATGDRPDGESGTDRHDHTVSLHAGDTVVFYTDGLIERRGEDLERGIDRLREQLAEHGQLPLPQLCDVLVQELAGELAGGSEDDVAVLALRAHPQQ